MKRTQFLLVLFVLSLCFAAIVPADGAQGARPKLQASAVDFDLKVIANSSVGPSEITIDELKAVFLLTKATLSDGSPVEPVLAVSGAAHSAFLGLLGKTDAALTAYLRGLVFTGKASMPKTCDSDGEMAAYVAKTAHAIGYVSLSAPSTGSKTLSIR